MDKNASWRFLLNFCNLCAIVAVMYEFLKGRLLLVRAILLACAAVLVITGIIAIYSIDSAAEIGAPARDRQAFDYWEKQAVFAAVGLVAFVAVNLVSYRRLGAASGWIYAAVVLLLAVLLVSKYIVALPFAPEINGAYRWIRFSIKGFEMPGVQPSEICKLAFILALGWYLRYRSNYRNFKALVGPFVLTLLPTVLILLEPDLGTVLLMMPILFVMLFAAGARIRHLLVILLLAVLCSPLLWFRMQPYQRTRISSVLLQSEWVRDRAEKHPLLGEILVGGRFSTKQWKNNWGYHLIRSKYAVASGGATGYGFGKGPFVKYNFLPERHNDFIFAIIAHEWGFVGCLLLLLVYVIVVACGLEIAANNTDPFGRLLATGIAAMFAIEVIVNVSMTVGLMPITGLTLPLVSYGGSSLVVSMAAVGLLNNVGRARPFTVAPKQ